MRFIGDLYRRFAHLAHELAKFGTIGALAAVVHFATGNIMLIGLGQGPLTSQTVAVAVATTIAFLGNRFWTFRHRSSSTLGREYFLFFVMNGIALLIQLLCIGFTVYTLKLTGPLAYNISGNVIGVGLGTLFRYWSYKKWVFLPPEAPQVNPNTGLPDWTDEAGNDGASAPRPQSGQGLDVPVTDMTKPRVNGQAVHRDRT
ncbi:MAG: GtrA family protein [Micromonosporaceae bacterium]